MRTASRFVCLKPSRDSLVATARPPARTAMLAERAFFGTPFACTPSCCVRRRAPSQVLVGQNASPPPWCLVIPLCPEFCCLISRVHAKVGIGASLAEIAEIAEIAESGAAVHPMGE